MGTLNPCNNQQHHHLDADLVALTIDIAALLRDSLTGQYNRDIWASGYQSHLL